MGNDEKKYIGFWRELYMNLLALAIQFMVAKKIVLSQQMKKIQKSYLKRVKLIR